MAGVWSPAEESRAPKTNNQKDADQQDANSRRDPKFPVPLSLIQTELNLYGERVTKTLSKNIIPNFPNQIGEKSAIR